jgi:hypothetical protein
VANTIDGDLTTAWRTEGDGIGETLTYRFADDPVYVTRVGLVPGWANVDPVDGTDRFTENRRVLRVRWTFDDGRSVVQELSEDPTLQMVGFPPVRSSSVRVEILETTDGVRDFTPVSEVAVEGVNA